MNDVSRRTVLTTAGVGLVTGLAGCQSPEEDEEPRPSLESAQGYQVAADQLVAVLDFSKPNENEAYTVPLRWELEISGEAYTRVTKNELHLRGEYPSPTVSMAFTSSIEMGYDEIERSELFWNGSARPWTSVPVNQDHYYATSSDTREQIPSSPN